MYEENMMYYIQMKIRFADILPEHIFKNFRTVENIEH